MIDPFQVGAAVRVTKAGMWHGFRGVITKRHGNMIQVVGNDDVMMTACPCDLEILDDPLAFDDLITMPGEFKVRR
jgi:GTP cyclohydrolase FolE2